MREKGIVKFYDSEKGYGYIERERKKDVHIGRDSFKGDAPSKGDQVEFKVIEEPRGPHAINLKVIKKSISSKKIPAISEKPYYYIPKDTRVVISPEVIDNYSLRLNKVPRYSKKKFEFFKTDRGREVINIKPDYSKVNIKAIQERHKNSIKKLNLKINSGSFSPNWRMVIGLGGTSVYETSMTLHHIYGIPYIPASALKGVVRSYIITEKFGKNDKGVVDLGNAENLAFHDQGFCQIFGDQKTSGNILFFDALPLTNPKVKPDVMNPHYTPYYSDSTDKVPPADYHNPKPIFFLTVEDTKFEFIIGIKEKKDNSIQNGVFAGSRPLAITYNWMKKALNEHGIGAKTAVGYGLMNVY